VGMEKLEMVRVEFRDVEDGKENAKTRKYL
jgi:hypothetical protein